MPFGLSLAIAADPFGSTERMETSVSATNSEETPAMQLGIAKGKLDIMDI